MFKRLSMVNISVLLVSYGTTADPGIVLALSGFPCQVQSTLVSCETFEQDLANMSEKGIVLCDLTQANLENFAWLQPLEKSPCAIIALLDWKQIVISQTLTALGILYCVKPVNPNRLFELISQRASQEHVRRFENNTAVLRQRLKELLFDQLAGQNLQRKLLPSSPWKTAHLEFEHFWRPSLYLSGDFLDYFALDEETVAFYMVDVAGHGTSSAFVTGQLKAHMQWLKKSLLTEATSVLYDPLAVAQLLNLFFLELKMSGFFTFFYGLFHLKNRIVSYVNAGQYPPLLLKNSQGWRCVSERSHAIGMTSTPHFSVQQLPLEHSQTLLLCSDGLLPHLKGAHLAEQEGSLLDRLQLGKPANLKQLLELLNIAFVENAEDDLSILWINFEF